MPWDPGRGVNMTRCTSAPAKAGDEGLEVPGRAETGPLASDRHARRTARMKDGACVQKSAARRRALQWNSYDTCRW